MDNVLTAWLKDTLVTDLLLGVNWLEAKVEQKTWTARPKRRSSWAGLYEDNGSCLEIINDIYRDKKSTLQIIKTSPLTISDGEVYIEASLTSVCKQDLASRYSGFQIAADSLYSLVSLRKYTLRATSYGPPAEKLHIIVQALDWEQSRSKSIFGQPQSIASSPQVTTLLSKLENTRAREDQKYAVLQTQVEDNTMSQENIGDEHPLLDNTLEEPQSQTDFGTQAVQLVGQGLGAHPRGRGGHVIGDNARSPLINDMEPIMLGNTKSRTLRTEDDFWTGDLQGPLGKPKSRAKPRHSILTGPSAEHQALLSLINHGKPPASEAPRVSPARYRGGRAGALEVQHDQIAAQRNERQRNVASQRKDGHPSPTPKAKPGVPKPRGDNVLPATTTTDLTTQEPAPEIASSQHTKAPVDANVFEAEAAWMLGWEYDAESANVAAEQQTLLMRPYSWQKPEPGHRPLVGSVPIDVQTEIDAAIMEKIASNGTTEDMEISDDSPNSADITPINTEHYDYLKLRQNIDEEMPTSQVSWSVSPSPRVARTISRADQDLPPDSSYDAQQQSPDKRAMDSQSILNSPLSHANIHSPHRGRVVEDLPSSPPNPLAGHDSGDEMELDFEIPQALGDDHAVASKRLGPLNDATPMSSLSPSNSVVQVKDTPFRRGKDRQVVAASNNPSSTRKPTSSATSKSTSSTTIIYGTYNKPTSTRNRHAEGNYVTVTSSGQAQADQPQDMYTAATDGDNMFMVDAEADPVQERTSPAPLQRESKGLMSLSRDTNEGQSFQSEASPALTEVPTGSISSRYAHHEGSVKRKSENSPSKLNSRQSKRRGIKIVGFGGMDEPSQDPSLTFRQEKEESIKRFREDREVHSGSPKSSSHTPDARLRQSYNIPVSRLGQIDDHERKLVSSLRNLDVDYDISRSESDQNTLLDTHVASNDRSLPTTPNNLRVESRKMRDNTVSAQKNLSQVEQISRQGGHRLPPLGPNAAMSPPVLELSKYGAEAPGSAGLSSIPDGEMTVFDRFKMSYPDYTGDVNHFIGQCKQMYNLDQEDKMIPKWQWDDYLIRNRTDYKEYALQLMELGEDVIPYIRFYKDNIQNTIYNKNVLRDSATLLEALEELGSIPAPAGSAGPFATPEQPRSRRSLPWKGNNMVESPSTVSPLSGHGARGRVRQSMPSISQSDRINPFRESSSNRERFPKHLEPSNPRSSTERSSSMTNTIPAQSPGPKSRMSGHTNGHTNGLATSRAESTSHGFSDFVHGQEKITSWSGSTRFGREKWPDSVSNRPSLPPRSDHDILSWRDEL